MRYHPLHCGKKYGIILTSLGECSRAHQKKENMAEEQQIEDHEVVATCGNILKSQLETILKKAGVVLDEDMWGEYNRQNRGVLAKILSAQETEIRENAIRSISEVRSVGRKKQIPLMVKSLEEWGVEKPEGYEAMAAVKLAAWCKITLKADQWSKLRQRAEYRNVSPGEWWVMEVEFDGDAPQPGCLDAAGEALQQEMEAMVSSLEQRGHHCRRDCFTVGDEETVIFKLTDYPEADEKWSDDEQDFKSSEGCSAFRIVVSFDFKACKLSILHQAGTRHNAERIGFGILKKAFGSKVRRARKINYTFDKLLKESGLPSAPDMGITSATVVGLDLELAGRKDRRRSYFEGSGGLSNAIRAELGAVVDADDTRVVRAHIKIMFGDGGRNHERTFRISANGGVAGWKNVSCDLRDKFIEYARSIGIVADANDQDAH